MSWTNNDQIDLDNLRRREQEHIAKHRNAVTVLLDHIGLSPVSIDLVVREMIALAAKFRDALEPFDLRGK